MNRIGIIAITIASLVVLSAGHPAAPAFGRENAQQSADVSRLNAASQAFIAAITARDILAMDKVWAHEPDATFIGPLSTTVVGWEGVRKAWEMRFGQFDRVTITSAEPYVRTNGKVAWSVGVEKVELLKKNGETLSFDAFVTNVFEKRGDLWLLVSHQATPVYKGAK